MNSFVSNACYDDEDEEKVKKEPMQIDKETLLKTRIITLFSEINKDSAQSVIRQLIMLDSDDCTKPIWIYVNSPGGEVDSGLAIYDIIRFVKSPVNMLGVGLIASAATIIYCAVDKSHRFSLEHSTYLIHQPLAKMRGVAIDVEIYAKKLDQIKKLLNTVLSQSTGKQLADVENDTDRDYTMTAAEALQYGLVGRIIRNVSEV